MMPAPSLNAAEWIPGKKDKDIFYYMRFYKCVSLNWYMSVYLYEKWSYSILKSEKKENDTQRFSACSVERCLACLYIDDLTYLWRGKNIY